MINIDDIKMGNDLPVVLIAGPCVIESEKHTIHMANELKAISENLDIPFIFKSSFDKANRTSIKSYRGPGLEEGLRILKKVKKDVGIPVISDVHETCQVKKAAKVLDAIQIPAFLCRQTDLIVEASKTGKPLNIKKGQFMSANDMKNSYEKAISTGNKSIMLTERGSMYGYNDLVVDMRSIQIMKSFCDAVVYDATHSVQTPGSIGTESGGQKQFIEPLAKAAVSQGIGAVFFEVHDKPEKAKCDRGCQVDIEMIRCILPDLVESDILSKNKFRKSRID